MWAWLAGAYGWRYLAGVGVAVLLLAWLVRLGIYTGWLELLIHADLNKDGVIGPEAVQPVRAQAESVRVELVRDEGRKGDYIDLPYPDKLPALAAGLLAGRTFNQTAWTGRVGIFSRSEFDQVRDTLIERGLACWKNPEARAQGVELTGAGRAVMRRLAAHPTTLPDERRH